MAASFPSAWATVADYTDTTGGATLLGFKTPYIIGQWLEQTGELSDTAHRVVSLFKTSYHLMALPGIPGTVRHIIKSAGELSIETPGRAFWTFGKLFTHLDILIGIRGGFLLDVWDSTISPIDPRFMGMFERVSTPCFLLGCGFSIAETTADLINISEQEAYDITTGVAVPNQEEIRSAKITHTLWKLAERISCLAIGIFACINLFFAAGIAKIFILIANTIMTSCSVTHYFFNKLTVEPLTHNLSFRPVG